MTNWFLDLLFPKHCLSCQREGFYICPECFAKIPIEKSFYCYICGRRSPKGNICDNCKKKTGSPLAGLLVASDWNNLLVRQMIYECKYRFVKELTLPLALVLIKFLAVNKIVDWGSKVQIQKTSQINWQTDKLILIPVPLHKRRENWRGFNQAMLIVEQLNQHLKIPAAGDWLKRNRHTPPQADIKDRSERIKNVAGAFLINQKIENNPAIREKIKNKIVILIDDVCTTASTLEQCARALKPFKPKEIWGLVVARG